MSPIGRIALYGGLEDGEPGSHAAGKAPSPPSALGKSAKGKAAARAGGRGRRRLSISLCAIAPAVLILAALIIADLYNEGLVGGTAGDAAPVGRIPSKCLTVTLLPLVPGEKAGGELAAMHSMSYDKARSIIYPAELKRVAGDLEELFPMRYEIGDPVAIPDEYWDSERHQYRIDLVLDWMLKNRDEKSFKTVGILAEDVYEPGFNFLFGLAKLGGPVCAASANRLLPERTGGKMSGQERYYAIVRHELGHSFGLVHSESDKSVMSYAESVRELETEGTELLPSEWKRLSEILPVEWER